MTEPPPKVTTALPQALPWTVTRWPPWIVPVTVLLHCSRNEAVPAESFSVLLVKTMLAPVCVPPFSLNVELPMLKVPATASVPAVSVNVEAPDRASPPVAPIERDPELVNVVALSISVLKLLIVAVALLTTFIRI